MLGYCLFPIALALIICRLILFTTQNAFLFFLRLVISMFGFAWATFGKIFFLKGLLYISYMLRGCIFIHTVLHVMQLQIDINNINTYYYKNTTKHCQSVTFHLQKTPERERNICPSILRKYLFSITNLNNVQLHCQSKPDDSI